MVAGDSRNWRTAVARLLLVAALSAPALAAPVEGPLQSVVFAPGDTIRGVAERYLKDADLWPQILELSGIASPTELRAGVELEIPVVQVAAADEALAFSLVAIQKATAEGARIFAPVEIGAAIENRDTAVEQRDLGAWAEVVSYAGLATGFADQALAISVAQRDRAAEAVVSDAQGSVEGRAPDQPRWSERSAQDVLVEFERLRTLSASTAQVTFRDLSRLRLNPNSNAVIQRMRSDPLTGGEVTKVSLVNGDFYALLNQLGDRTNFEVAVPGLETATQSADFWVKHDDEGSRFTNYDAAALEITRGAEKSRSARTRAPWCRTAARPSAPGCWRAPSSPCRSTAPRSSTPASPSAGSRPRGPRATGSRSPPTPSSTSCRPPNGGCATPAAASTASAPGDHYWRVSSLDRLGLPGVRSLSWRFRIVDDETPPFVTLTAPKEAEIVTTAEVAVAGEAEPGARVTVNDAEVPLAADGSFALTVTPAEGENTLRVAAVDPAGNRTERTRAFSYRPVGAVAITLDARVPRDADGRLLTASPELALAGVSSAEAGAGLRVVAADGAVAVQTLVDDGGGFHFTVPATETGAAYRIEILGADQKVAGSLALAARRDATPPDIALDLPPKATANAWLDVTGAAAGAVAVTVNGSPGRLDGDRFAATANLVPGMNAIEIVATDAVGNVALKRVETMYDVDPPEIVAAAVGPPGRGGGADRGPGRGARRLGHPPGRALSSSASAGWSGAASSAATARPASAARRCRRSRARWRWSRSRSRTTRGTRRSGAIEWGEGRHATSRRHRGLPRARSARLGAGRSRPGAPPRRLRPGGAHPRGRPRPYGAALHQRCPADLADRLYLRVFDPEPSGAARHPLRPRLRRHHDHLPPLRRRGCGLRRAAAGAGHGRHPLRPRPRHRRLLRRPRPRRAHASTWRAPPTASGSRSPPSPPPTAS